MADNVNHPAHYETGRFECIEVMIETQGVQATMDFCVCNGSPGLRPETLAPVL